jgi:predicted AAA+ superfamily ATPase
MQNMIHRKIQKLLQHRLAEYPAVALVGPRQCGKTTLAQALGGLYFDLEQMPERLRLDLEWEDLEKSDDLVILDEAQSWPEVFPRLRGAIDRDRKRTGRFLLLGSVSPSLMIRVSESLAGRLSLIELTPFLLSELKARSPRESLWLCGGYPDGGVLKRESYPRWQRDYLALLSQRDLPSWGLPARPEVTDRLLRMLTAVHGQTWNASQIGQSLGLSYHTVNSYLDYLVGAFMIRRLPPYRPNIRKRLVKSPKVYWRDTGLLHAQLNVADESSLLTQPWVGASWEGFVIEQAIGVLNCVGHPFEAFYFRTSDQHGIDLVLDLGGELWALEVKLTASPGPTDMDRLDKAADMIGASRRYLVSKTKRTTGGVERASCNLRWLLEHLQG